MHKMKAIFKRRSIRKYKPLPISQEIIQEIIYAGLQAPSPKNRQPWRFVVVTCKEAKEEMLQAMRAGIEAELRNPKLPDRVQYIGGAENTLAIMEQAPVTIFVINPQNDMNVFPETRQDRFREVCNLQAVGACIQNMLLAATSLGFGSLWNCDIYFAYDEIAAWLNTEEQVVAAVSFGFPDQDPFPRPRNAIDDVLEWK